MKSAAQGIILPPGSMPPIELTGDHQSIVLKEVRPENGYDEAGDAIPSSPDGTVLYEAVTVYPDGYERHHQVKDVSDLLVKVASQLKTRYNLLKFEVKTFPSELKAGETIEIEGVEYVA